MRPPRAGSPGVFRAASVALFAALSTLVPAVAHGDVERKPSLARRAGKKELVWQDLDAGLDVVRSRYLPLLVWYEGDRAAGDADGESVFLEVLGHASMSSKLRKYALIRIGSADLTEPYPIPPSRPRDLSSKRRGAAKRKPAGRPEPKPKPAPVPAKKQKPVTVGERLRIPAGRPALLVLDFRERVVERYDGDLPSRTKLSSRLRHVDKVNGYFAKRAFGIEKALVEAQRAHDVGNSRAAVLKVRDLESEKMRKVMDPVLQGWAAKSIEIYRGSANKLLAEAEELEREGDKLRVDSSLKYNKALRAFARVAESYPFKDVMEKANRHRADILRKMTVTGENPFK